MRGGLEPMKVLTPKSHARHMWKRVPKSLWVGGDRQLILQCYTDVESGSRALPWEQLLPVTGYSVMHQLARHSPGCFDLVALWVTTLWLREHPDTSVRMGSFYASFRMPAFFEEAAMRTVVRRYESLPFEVALFHQLEIPYGWVGRGPLQCSLFPIGRHHPLFAWYTSRYLWIARRKVFALVLNHLLRSGHLETAIRLGFTCRAALVVLRGLLGSIGCNACGCRPRWEVWEGFLFQRNCEVRLLRSRGKCVYYLLHRDRSVCLPDVSLVACTMRAPWRYAIETPQALENFLGAIEVEHEENLWRFTSYQEYDGHIGNY